MKAIAKEIGITPRQVHNILSENGAEAQAEDTAMLWTDCDADVCVQRDGLYGIYCPTCKQIVPILDDVVLCPGCGYEYRVVVQRREMPLRKRL